MKIDGYNPQINTISANQKPVEANQVEQTKSTLEDDVVTLSSEVQSKIGTDPFDPKKKTD